MAKLTQFKNPLTNNSGSVTDYTQWIGGVLWVVMVGLIISIGAKALGKVDAFIPGNQTPNIKAYQNAAPVGQSVNIL